MAAMGKLIFRLLFLGMIALSAYLYYQVWTLQRENAALSHQVVGLASLRAENSTLRAKLAKRGIAVAPRQTESDWLDSAQEHVENAEQAARRGDFGTAYREAQEANEVLSKAADAASSQSRGAVQALRERLRQVQDKAQSVIKVLND
jgi:hypothetical protein